MFDILNNIASLVGLTLGVIYGFGLIIVTIHLNRYGITNIYLIKTKYLVVGFVYFLHILGWMVLATPVVVALAILFEINALSYITGIVGGLGFLFLLLSGYAPKDFEHKVNRFFNRRGKSPGPNVYWRIWQVAIYFSSLLAIYSLLRSFNEYDFFFRTLAIILGISIFISGLAYYALFLYQSPIAVGNPALELIGGGRPILVQISVEKDSLTSLQNYGLFETGAAVSKPVLLLDETDQELIVLVESEDKEKALKLSKSIVTSVMYLA